MQSKFFAFMARMKFVNRWSLMRNTTTENIAEHSLNVSMIAHCLALIENKFYGGKYDVFKIGMIGAYHETSEVITGDLPTPIKYFSKEMRDSYKSVEKIANDTLLATLPKDFVADFDELINASEEEYLLVKYADKLTAYIKCIEETACGNSEFKQAGASILLELKSFNSKSVDYFLEVFIPAYSMTLDELGGRV
ncbi:MAG: 5'-deoxynucleotidase [Clostridia bacterium]|nr:5'-deoxynucleotidase [Clostridia bacterium]